MNQQTPKGDKTGINDMLVQIPEALTTKVLSKQQVLSADEVTFLQNTKFAIDCNAASLHLGVSAIGELMTLSAYDVSQDSIYGIGWHLTLIGQLMEGLQSINKSCDSLLEENRKLQNPNH